ncbi:hypothetical protein [Photorhabdus luminescens]|uniref:Uncharacterized protein n=1 Tax=Photorhabdus luminescens subsp. mexicana TaxID=2100167 RepID=A0A4R4JNI0_PHOLU|nr:hypothetical protein [Photorhabdus luminescens]TDB56084.1 hypothetical protein C5468_02395 [Photorhabdus luminescens subsp. mexicana]
MEAVGKKFEPEVSASDYPVWLIRVPDSNNNNITEHLTLAGNESTDKEILRCINTLISQETDKKLNIPVIFPVASLLAALAHPGHIISYAPGDSLPCRRDAS